MSKKQKKQQRKIEKRKRKLLREKFEKACKKLKIIPSIPNVEGLPCDYQQRLITTYMLMVVLDYERFKLSLKYSKKRLK